MKVVTTAVEIRNTLRELEPQSIAVAYVGSGWKQYVSTEHLREIVLSPTLGSNPRAIEEIMNALGHENVYFLDTLHSKIYLGAHAALLGSCNLSDGGISDGGRLEAAIVLTDADAMCQLAVQIEGYKKAASKLYDTQRKKLARLRKLKVQSERAQWYGVADIRSKIPTIRDYESRLDRIHVVWCGSFEDEFDEKQIGLAVHEAKDVGPETYFNGTLQFLEADDVRPGDWVLCWKCNNDGMPRKAGEVSWLYVHHVVSGGYKTDDYPKLAGEAKAKFLRRPAPPFALDKSTKGLIRKTLASRRFPEMLSLDNAIWPLGPADAVTPKFIQALRTGYRG